MVRIAILYSPETLPVTKTHERKVIVTHQMRMLRMEVKSKITIRNINIRKTEKWD